MTVEEPARRVEKATDAFDQLATLLDRFEPLETVLDRLVQSVAATIPDTGSATVTIVRGEEPRTAAASHTWAAELDDCQYHAQDGPCLEAARTGQLVRLDTSKPGRWPEYCRAARDQEVAVALGAPLLIDPHIARTTAALNLTAPEPNAFDPLDEALLEMVTHAVATAINHAYQHQKARGLVEQLGNALDHRDTIGQAKGLLMARHNCGPDEAFEHLRKASQQANVKLHEVAARLVERESDITR
ncbi:GAF and ANTAR domain-containing protein [Saccharopolyspora rhizosphaerae]|uniref:GAF and ANTAR domain-containing protein n=1 Tax=Saccharopolyspora rhizosphaerae TaxID=2492662 RepID=UPI0013159556|nr:GAF and ANTAR domain-containing protein [Saccharopolyspora rhizosphaerae]